MLGGAMVLPLLLLSEDKLMFPPPILLLIIYGKDAISNLPNPCPPSSPYMRQRILMTNASLW